MNRSYRALVVRELADGGVTRSVEALPVERLPDGDVLIRVRWSSLNYKDALSASGNKGVTRKYPHTPGIDAAGVVEVSSSPSFTAGDEVLVTGYELGSNHPGGFAEYVRVPASWVVPLPPGLSLRESMALGTAGFTAALAVHRLRHHGVVPESGELLVTGASGGVGCLAVALLARLGYTVVASTGKEAAHPLLRRLGAAQVIGRGDVLDDSGKGLIRGRWAGAVDTVGGAALDSCLRAVQLFGAVAACGNVTSSDLHTSVYPFILRGVALLGVNSAFTPMALRREVWDLLARSWRLPEMDLLVRETGLEQLETPLREILEGAVAGRVVVRL